MQITRWFHRIALFFLCATLVVSPSSGSARERSANNDLDQRGNDARTAASSSSAYDEAGVVDPEQWSDPEFYQRKTQNAVNQQASGLRQDSYRADRTTKQSKPNRQSLSQPSLGQLIATRLQATVRFQRLNATQANTSLADTNTLYLPLVLANPLLANQITVYPDRAVTLASTDGRVVLTIPTGAVSEPTTIRYTALPIPSVADYEAIGPFFELVAISSIQAGNPSFLKPSTLRIIYPQTWRSSSLVLLHRSAATEWASLPMTLDSSQRSMSSRIDNVGQFGIFSHELQSCTTPLGGAGMSLQITTAFSTTYESLKLPCPAAVAAMQSGTWMQQFPPKTSDPTLPAGFLVYNANKTAAFYLSINGKTQFLSNSWLGLPVANYDKGGPPPTFKDEVHNFVGTPIMYFDKGFVSDTGVAGEAHRWFPQVKTANVTMTPYQIGSNIYNYEVKFDFGFDTFGGITGIPQLETKINGQNFDTASGFGADTWVTTLSKRVPYKQQLDFSMKVQRSTVPSSGNDPDSLFGYIPCTYMTGAKTYSFTPIITETVSFANFAFTCDSIVGGGGEIIVPPADTEAPVFHYVDVFPAGSTIHVKTNVTDNRAVASVELDFNGQGYALMTHMGGNLYAVKVSGKKTGSNTYLLRAKDPAGNTSTFPANGQPIAVAVDQSYNYGLNCYQGFCGDPINTQNGNYTDCTTDAHVSGVGDTDIEIQRCYNSLAAVAGNGGTVRLTEDAAGAVQQTQQSGPSSLFGRIWTFPYAISLTVVDDAVASFARAFYPDGRTVTFEKQGGVFKSTTPQNHDLLIKTGVGYELRHKRSLEVDVFDGSGKLIAHRDRNNNTITFEYSGDKLTKITNASGRSATLIYNGDGFIEQIDMAEGKTLRYEYANGNLVAWTDGNNGTTRYEYNAKHQITAIITPKTHPKFRMTYDDQGRVSQQVVGAAETYTLTYSEDGKLTTTTDTYGNQTKHYYDDEGRLIKNEDALGKVEEYKYDDDFNRIWFKDRGGREYTYTFDERGNKLTEIGPLDWHQAWTYNELDRVTSFSDAENRTTTMQYDDRGNLTKITNAASDSSSTTYDSRGLPLSISDFNGNVTVNTFDPTTGDLRTSTNGESDSVGFSYDALGRVITMINGNTNTYHYSYDLNDNLTAVDGPLSYHLGYRYDPNNNRTHVVDPNGGTTETIYDQSESVVEVKNQLRFSTKYEYNAMKHLTKVTDAEGRVLVIEYDAVYNPIAEHAPEDTHTFTTFDPMHNPTQITRCLSTAIEDDCAQKQVEVRRYDERDQLTALIANYDPSVAPDADSNVMTEFAYDRVGNITQIIDANNNPTFYQYDKLNRVTRIEDAEQQITLTEYDGMGNITTLTNPRQLSTLFTYDKANRLQKRTDADQKAWLYGYDHNSNLTTITDPNNVMTRYDFDALDRTSAVTQNFVAGGAATVAQNVRTGLRYDLAGNLRFIDDARGIYTTEHQYDAARRRIATIDNENGRTEFSYDKLDNVLVVLDANRHTTNTQYDGLNRITYIANAENHRVGFKYDRLNNLLQLTDARGFITKYRYDGINRPDVVTDARNGVWQSVYDAMGNVLTGIDANSHSDAFVYDKVYRLKSVTDAEGYVTSSTYDPNGNRLTLTDGNNHTSNFTYDVLDRLATFTNAENETTRYAYNALGNQTRMTEADNVATAYGFDPLYRLNSVTLNFRAPATSNHETNVTTQYKYDHVGNMTHIVAANSNPTIFTFDGMNRLTREVDAENNQWDYGYDLVGNRTQRIDAKRDRTNYSYYPDNQLQTIGYNDGTSVAFEYDPNNNRTSMVDHLGRTTWSFDQLNRPTDVTDAFDRHLGYGYDAVGNRVSLTYADDLTVQYRYFRNDWLKGVYDPEANHTSYERDGVGLMTHTSNPNGTVADATYDRANRMLAIENRQVQGNDIISRFAYSYNDVGHTTRTQATYGWRNPRSVTSEYQYDPLRRLTRDSDSQGIWTEYDFDAVGNRLELRTNDDSESPRPFDAKTLTYSYNKINQIQTIVGDTHPGQGNVKRGDNVAQSLHAFRHEVAAQRGKHIAAATADDLLNRADTLIAQLYSQRPPRQNEISDALDSLREAVNAARSSGAIDSDGIANSLLVKLDKGDAANNGTSGDLQTTTFSYDPNGNRSNKEFPGPQGPRVQGTDYRFDRENRLIEAQDYQGNAQGNRVDRAVTRPDYDGIGRRLVKEYDPKTGNGGTKRVEYVFDGLDPVAEYNIWNPQRENFYRGDMNRIIEMQHFPSGTAGQMFWYHYDALGSVTGLTKHQGQSTHNYRYEAYGQIEMPPGNFSDPHNHYTFTGQELDENTGFYDFFSRNYDYSTGTWLTQDSYRGEISDPRSLHRLGYVTNNPTSYVDAYGYWGFNPFKAVGDAVSNTVSTVANTVTSTASFVAEKASQAVDTSVQWAKENQDVIAKVAITAAAVVGTAALCTALPGVGCVIGAGLIAAVGSYGDQVVDNAWKASGGTTLFDSKLYNKDTLFNDIQWDKVAVDGILGAATPALGTKLKAFCKTALCLKLGNGAIDFSTAFMGQMSDNYFDPYEECTDLLDGAFLSGIKKASQGYLMSKIKGKFTQKGRAWNKYEARKPYDARLTNYQWEYRYNNLEKARAAQQ